MNISGKCQYIVLGGRREINYMACLWMDKENYKGGALSLPYGFWGRLV